MGKCNNVFENTNYAELNLEDNKKIDSFIEKLTNVIENPDTLLKNVMEGEEVKQVRMPIQLYANVCTLIAAIMESDYNNLESIAHTYMIRIREELYKNLYINKSSLFSGLSGVGFGIQSIYKKTGSYEKFLTSLNKIIVDNVNSKLEFYRTQLGNVKMEYYDIIQGMSGTLAYLLLFKENEEIYQVINEVLKYLVSLSRDIKVYGHSVPGWYIPSENQFLNKEKHVYKNGNFNIGISHGVTGILAALSIALKDGIEIDDQRESILKILSDLKRFYYESDKGAIYWPGRICYEHYIDGHIDRNFNSRASWCYGTPGIARAMYLGGTAVDDKSSLEVSLKAMDALFSMEDEEWLLDTPIFCHGYAGLLTIAQAMYRDTGNEIYNTGGNKVLTRLLSYYNEAFKYGFQSIEFKDAENDDFTKVCRDSIDMLEGVIGIALSLIYTRNHKENGFARLFLIS